jgi:hypothetical protein
MLGGIGATIWGMEGLLRPGPRAPRKWIKHLVAVAIGFVAIAAGTFVLGLVL